MKAGELVVNQGKSFGVLSLEKGLAWAPIHLLKAPSPPPTGGAEAALSTGMRRKMRCISYHIKTLAGKEGQEPRPDCETPVLSPAPPTAASLRPPRTLQARPVTGAPSPRGYETGAAWLGPWAAPDSHEGSGQAAGLSLSAQGTTSKAQGTWLMAAPALADPRALALGYLAAPSTELPRPGEQESPSRGRTPGCSREGMSH